MKLITGKSFAVRPEKTTNANLSAVTAISHGAAKMLAVECWRMGKLISPCQDRFEQGMMQDCVDRMTAALFASGISIRDPEGSEWTEGMRVNVVDFDFCDELERGQRVVIGTLSPHIYIDDQLVQIARVIVAVGARDA